MAGNYPALAFLENATCDDCGKQGVYDAGGDYHCAECLSRRDLGDGWMVCGPVSDIERRRAWCNEQRQKGRFL
jgi:hypothetical protein